MTMRALATAGLVSLIFLGGCALRPPGEEEERARAGESGTPYALPPEQRALAELGPEASWEDHLRYAFLNNAELERSFYEWRAALERIPQAASVPTTAAVSYSQMFDGGGMSAWDRSTLMLQTDPMANLPWPSKLRTAGRAALEEARAAGLRFDRARLELQEQVLRAWLELGLLGEELRIQEETVQLLDLLVTLAEARTRAGTAPQQDLVQMRIELDLVRNDLLTLRSQEPGRRAELNALLNRPADAPVTARLPAPRHLPFPDDQVLAMTAERNPELLALAQEVRGRSEALELARLQVLPDFAFSASITGTISQLLGAMISLPSLRREAIQGGIAEAEADLRATAAMRRQLGHDLAARAVLELYALRNFDREVDLFSRAILPRSEQLIELAKAAYQSGQAGLAEVLLAQRTLLDVQLTLARLRAGREQTLAALEAVTAVDLSRPAPAAGTDASADLANPPALPP